MSDCGCSPTAADTQDQPRVLWNALALNATMFFVEVTAGWLVHSTALAADGLGMLPELPPSRSIGEQLTADPSLPGRGLSHSARWGCTGL